MKLDISNTRFSNAFKTFSFFFFPKLSPQTLQTLHQVFTLKKIYSSVHTLADISHSHLAFVQIFQNIRLFQNNWKYISIWHLLSHKFIGQSIILL